MKIVFFKFICACMMFLLCGCQADHSAAPTTPTTYSEHIQPLLAKYCVACHSNGEIAPFPLEDYQQAKMMATDMKIATANRTMPPYSMDASGSCQTFKNHGWLTDAEINRFSRWLAEGMPEGPVKPATPPQLLEHLNIDAYSLTMANFYVPSSGPDDYRCFPMDSGLTQQKFLTAYELEPGDKRIVHHVLLFKTSDVAYQQALIKASKEVGLGYSCFGGTGVADSLVGAWGPGSGVTRFPVDTGIRFTAGQKLIMQVHYNIASGSFPDQSTLKLEYKNKVAKEGYVQEFNDASIYIPPNQSNVLNSKIFNLSSYLGATQSSNLWKIMPHAHQLGRQMRVTRINSAGQEQCLGDIPHWRRNWQRFFDYQTPVLLKSSDKIRLDCYYDSTGVNQATYFGLGSLDEMCMLFTYSTLNP